MFKKIRKTWAGKFVERRILLFALFSYMFKKIMMDLSRQNSASIINKIFTKYTCKSYIKKYVKKYVKKKERKRKRKKRKYFF